MKKIRILVADDHTLMRMGLAALVACENDMEIAGEARNGREAVELAARLNPDVVIMDLMMPELPGVQAARRIRKTSPGVKMLILTSFGTAKELSEAIADGVDAVVMKDAAVDELVQAVRAIFSGERIIPGHLLRQAEEDTFVRHLTARQMEILSSVARGLSNSEIARQFDISEIAVKKHLSVVFDRLGVTNRAEAVAFALKKHMLQQPPRG